MKASAENAADVEEAYAKYPGVKALVNMLIEDLIEVREEVQRLQKVISEHERIPQQAGSSGR